MGEHQSWPFWGPLSCKCRYRELWRISPDPENNRQICYHLPTRLLPHSPTHLGSSLDKTSQAEDDSSLVLLDHFHWEEETEGEGDHDEDDGGDGEQVSAEAWTLLTGTAHQILSLAPVSISIFSHGPSSWRHNSQCCSKLEDNWENIGRCLLLLVWLESGVLDILHSSCFSPKWAELRGGNVK